MDASRKLSPRVGIPWRTLAEEKAGQRARYEAYLSAICDAGGEPVEVSLLLGDDNLRSVARSCDAFVLPGSPADIDPKRYGGSRHRCTADPDVARERADEELLEYVLASGRPLLAICFGLQSLNVHLGGSLVQDIPSEVGSSIKHDHAEDNQDVYHAVKLQNCRLGGIEGQAEIRVNSSHHQAVLTPGRDLSVTAWAQDGVVEALEWTGGPGWIVGVQWHPERMNGDAFSAALFRRLILECQRAPVR